jgi:hypothetical protein
MCGVISVRCDLTFHRPVAHRALTHWSL